MRYKKFVISDFKGITGPVEVDIERFPFLPIIGLNESGKSSFLEALFAFDISNDEVDDGRHLRNVRNIWQPGQAPDPIVSAEITLTPDELLKAAKDQQLDADLKDRLGDCESGRWPSSLTIHRNLATRSYSFSEPVTAEEDQDRALAERLLYYLPYITLVDDHAGLFPATLRVSGSSTSYPSDWLANVDQVFKLAKVGHTVFDLGGLDELARRDVLDQVNDKLNSELAKEWSALRLRSATHLYVEFSYAHQRVKSTGPNSRNTGNYIDITVKELDTRRQPHRLSLDSRSRGFWWFFTFAMRLRFSSRTPVSSRNHEVILLDEPASYLHTAAQQDWCAAFKTLSKHKSVVYTTHSQFMLDPRYISPRTIHFAERSTDGQVSLRRFYEVADGTPNQRQSLQPAIDALEIRPFMLHITPGERVLIAEGIYDYYSFEMFKGERQVTIFPATGATNIEHHIPYMIAWSTDFMAIWDNDEEGREARDKAAHDFGDQIAEDRLFTLPVSINGDDTRLENLWDHQELESIRAALGLPQNQSFEKIVLALFYDSNRAKLISTSLTKTAENFGQVFSHLGLTT